MSNIKVENSNDETNRSPVEQWKHVGQLNSTFSSSRNSVSLTEACELFYYGEVTWLTTVYLYFSDPCQHTSSARPWTNGKLVYIGICKD